MGDSKRRKLLDPNYGLSAISPSEDRQKNLYKKSKLKLRPDLGMHLFPDQIVPFQLLAPSSTTAGFDRYLGTTICGVTESFSISRVDEHPLPSIPLDESYVFSIYFGERLSETDSLSMVSKLSEQDGLIVIPDPSKKYLTENKSEWVLPLKFIGCVYGVLIVL